MARQHRNEPINTNIMKLNRYIKVGGIALATFFVVTAFFIPGIIVIVFLLLPVGFLIWVYWSLFKG